MSPDGYHLTTIHQFVGRELGVSDWLTIDQDGYLTLALLPKFQFAIGLIPPDAAQAINYGLDRVRFLAPVKAGARIRNRVVLLAAEDKGGRRVLIKTQNTIEIAGEPTPAMVAEALAMLSAGCPEGVNR